MADYPYIDSDGELLTEEEAQERYRDFLDEIYESVTIGEITFNPSTILEECDPIAFRVYFSEWMSESEDLDYYTPGHEWENGPVCEDCEEKMSDDEATVALDRHKRLMCESCEEDWTDPYAR